MIGVYLKLSEDLSFHSIILKLKKNNQIYILAIGYAGGGSFEEFFAKLSDKSKVTDSNGFFSPYINSDEWEKEIIKISLDKEENKFKIETEELYEPFEDLDYDIQYDIHEELKKYIKWGYDEETDEDLDNPILKSFDFGILNKIEDEEVYYNDEWSQEFMEITQTEIWGLSLMFNS